MFTPFAFIKSPSPVSLNGLVAWYDAADYVSGATWVDRSVNGLDLTISGSTSLTTLYGQPYLDWDSSTYAYTSATSLLAGASDVTVILINYIQGIWNDISAASLQGYGEWGIGDGAVSNFVFAGVSVDNSSPVYYTAPLGVWVNGQTGYRTDIKIQAPWPGVSGLGTFEFNYPVMDEMWYSGGDTPVKNNMVAYRFGSGFNGSTLKIGRVDSGPSVNNVAPPPYPTIVNTWPTGYEEITDSLPLTLYRSGYVTTYNLGASANIILGKPITSGSGGVGGFWSVAMFYNRQITDSELTQIYEYYKPRYSFR